MKSVNVGDRQDPVLVDTRTRVLDVILAAKEQVMMACGGKGLCATCHCYVEDGAENLTPMTQREKLSLQMLSEVRPNSRLACQAKVLGEGVKIRMPKGRYITGAGDLEDLVGRRTDSNILHPVDGRILVEAGKIITRSRIRALGSVDLDVAEMKARSMTA